jgi:hypothetical protein
MTSIIWSLVDVASQLLAREEREVVRGDLMEAHESAWQGLLDVLGLVVRREAALWKHWRPWLAALGLVLPGSFLRMGASMSASWMYQHFIAPKALQASGLTPDSGLLLLIWQIFLLIGWSWTGGFVVGSVSRRTLWVSISSACAPCLVCLARFRVESLSRLCLLLFLLPAIWGVRQGLRIKQIKLRLALVLAVTITALMINEWGHRGSWVIDWALIWPAWYIVATARRPSRQTGSN